MVSRTLVILGFVVLLATPFLFRTEAPVPPDDARRLIIITPHNEQIRGEFAGAFDAWHERAYGERVNVIFNVPGGTSEIRKMLEAQFTAAFEAGETPGGAADLVFGGGSYEHGRLKRGVNVTVGGETRREPISAPVEFEQSWLDETYGPNTIGDGRIYDPERHWFGLALSGFGIVFNRDALAAVGVDEPNAWEDLCHPDLRGWVALVNPSQSGSITTAFEAILQQRGWDEGWRILRRAAANARYFSASSLKPPTDVSQGDAAMGVCIDFYGRFQSQAVKVAGGGERVGYVDPPGASTIDADPISMLRGAPDPALAMRFIEFCLSDAGQALWQFRLGERERDGLGPAHHELRRPPVRRAMYERFSERMVDRVNPFELAREAAFPDRNMRAFIAVVFTAMAMDNHEELAAAWSAIVEHPAYPNGGGLVTADDVTDPGLARMLERFDAMPVVATPEGETVGLGTPEGRATVRDGWLDGGWSGQGLWNDETSPRDVLRRRFVEFYRVSYESIAEGTT